MHCIEKTNKHHVLVSPSTSFFDIIKLNLSKSIMETHKDSFYYAFIVKGVCLELKKLMKNYDLIKLRFRKVKLNRKMPGILDRIKPRTGEIDSLGFRG